jgi:hypothetical protein
MIEVLLFILGLVGGYFWCNFNQEPISQSSEEFDKEVQDRKNYLKIQQLEKQVKKLTQQVKDFEYRL